MTLREQIEIKSNSGINWRCTTIQFDTVALHIYFYETNEKPEYFSSTYKILEESKKQNWGKRYSVRFDKMNYGAYDPNKDHLHVFLKNNQLFAINRDGTAHDKSHGKKIPNYVSDKIKQEYPDFILPADNLIESVENLEDYIQNELLFLLDEQEQYKNEILRG